MPIPKHVQVNIMNMNTLVIGSGIRLMLAPLNEERHRIVIRTAFFLLGRQEMTKLRNEKMHWEAMRVKITLSSIVPTQISGVCKKIITN